MSTIKLKHISHNDLDGYGCTILTKLIQRAIPGYLQVNIENINPNQLIPIIEETILNLDQYDRIFITDLSFNQDAVKAILNCSHPEKFFVFDHHRITDEVKELLTPNFTIQKDSPRHEGKLTSGTELYYEFVRHDPAFAMVLSKIGEEQIHAISHFVDCVRRYDTYEFWKERNAEDKDIAREDAPRLNTLFYAIGREEFEEYILDYFFGEADQEWMQLTCGSSKYPYIADRINYEIQRNDRYIKNALKRLIITPFECTIYRDGQVYQFKYKCGVIFAEQNSSAIGNSACEQHPEIDFCAVINNNIVSLYTTQEDVDVSIIARVLGGGGHKEASGFSIPYSNANIFSLNHFFDMVKLAGRMGPEIQE